MKGSAASKLALEFFFLLQNDQEAALRSATQAIKSFKKSEKINPEVKSDVLLIQSLMAVLKRSMKNRKQKTKSFRIFEEAHHEEHNQEIFDLSRAHSLQAWQNAQKNLEFNLSPVLVLRYVLKLSLADIAEALKLPQGTILYRIGQGLQKLQVAK